MFFTAATSPAARRCLNYAIRWGTKWDSYRSWWTTRESCLARFSAAKLKLRSVKCLRSTCSPTCGRCSPSAWRWRTKIEDTSLPCPQWRVWSVSGTSCLIADRSMLCVDKWRLSKKNWGRMELTALSSRQSARIWWTLDFVTSPSSVSRKWCPLCNHKTARRRSLKPNEITLLRQVCPPICDTWTRLPDCSPRLVAWSWRTFSALASAATSKTSFIYSRDIFGSPLDWLISQRWNTPRIFHDL